ncbi:hypothetical protein TanjilG_03971 [Lupinus angustifolius]|uniref:Pseudouridine synthase I TruA alpha/beta domain-containing protein n=1 Tax=Lupinus angustifolius TaxID=3871 RepID=A0A4P1RB09_LUPAN|nr:hypothetical protein TanjilG_03971 [Lupinus angustifolius]
MEEEKASLLRGEIEEVVEENIKNVGNKVPEVEIQLYHQGRGPISVFKSKLGGWEQDQLQVHDILQLHALKSIYAFNPGSGRGVPIRFNPRNGRSILTYRDGAVVYVDGEPKELEAENAKLVSLLADCHSREIENKLHGPDEKGMQSKKGNRKSGDKIEKMPGHYTRFMSHHSKRYIALKVMYFGKRFYGFASEAQMEPTVESEIFKALEKTRLLVGDRKDSQYSRCGRTDKGVSAVGQVVALFLRSNLKISEANNGSPGEIVLDKWHG